MLRAATAKNSKAGFVFLFLVVLCLCTTLVQARQPFRTDEQSTVTVSELPRQGQETYQLILSGGPFPYAKDGIVFGNYEHQLPPRTRGYYHEYTVKTPRAHNRGARRIVCGGPRVRPDACYYTGDHYATFRRIVE